MELKATPLEIYASTHAVNSAAAQMTEHLVKLTENGLIGPEEGQRRIAAIEEIRAMTSADVGMNMSEPELGNAAAAEKTQLAIEEKWKQSVDDTAKQLES
jgi:hypothetical protein